jgi:tRNA-modifying protein YgfZ
MNPLAPDNPSWLADYEAMTQRAAFVELGHRTQIEVSGADRASFVHNLCTNEVRKLAGGAGCEAFMTTVQGKILAHVFIFAGADSLVIETVDGQSDTILKHLDHYLVSERVTLSDRTSEWSELFVAGPDSEQLIETLFGAFPTARLAHLSANFEDRLIAVRRADLAGPIGFLLSGRTGDIAALDAAIVARGVPNAGQQAFEAARIEWGFPFFGRDISAANLPQEVARDNLAISFTKGCYLGQETIARIDALGHVNKTLVGLRCESPEIPASGALYSVAGQAVGEVTSAAFSPRLGCPLALAFVRRGHTAAGTRLEGEGFGAEVVTLPVASASARR